MSFTVLQLHKRASYQFENIQDKFAFNEANKCFALADGTTQSFNSETWAEIITKCFVTNPTFENEKLIADFTNCVKQYKNTKFEFSTNPAKASLEKTKQNQGGTATFIGLQFLQDNHFNVISCGDTNLFILSKDNIEYFPYSDIEILDANNFFINTEQLLQEKTDETYFQTKTFSFHKGDTILLATDALSRLILKQPNVISELTAISNFESLLELCSKYWDKKELEEDDVSAIIIKIDNQNKIIKILPSNDFSFPEEKEVEFIPTSLTQRSNQNNFTKMDMQEIRHQFNGVANDFHQVKKRLKFQEMLLLVAISIGILNFLCFLYFRLEPQKGEKENSNQNNEISIIQKSNETIESLKNKVQSLEKEIIEFTTQKNEDKIDEVKPKNEKELMNGNSKTVNPKKEK